MNKKFLLVGITILFLGVAVAPLTQSFATEKSNNSVSSDNTLYVGGVGSGNFSLIQDAIDNASDGDTVFVYAYSSPYYENLIVDKSINLIGEDKDTTVIDGSSKAQVVIQIVADGVHLNGFTIINYGKEAVHIHANYTILSDNIIGPDIQGWSGNGIQLFHSNNNVINGNIVSKTFDAMQIFHSYNNTIADNTILSSYLYGIWLSDSNNNIVSSNNISTGSPAGLPGSYKGIRLTYSNDNSITNNVVISQHEECYGGLQLWDSSNNIVNGNTFVQCGLEWYGIYNNQVEENTVNEKPLVYLIGKNNQVIENAGQVFLIQCTGCTIQNLEISNTETGIDLFETNNCLITGNTIINNWYGVRLDSAKNNEIIDNVFSDNKYSIYVKVGSSHTIISDNIVKNSRYTGISTSGAFTTIERNTVVNNSEGIIAGGIFSLWNSITSNVIQQNWNGLVLASVRFSTVSSNIISDNFNGLYVKYLAKRNNIISNEIMNNVYGINLSYANVNTITHNNFIGNEQHATFNTAFRNTWKRNYWEGDILPPTRISGMISFYKTDFWGVIMWELHIPWVNFDWRPAQEPYDIRA